MQLFGSHLNAHVGDDAEYYVVRPKRIAIEGGINFDMPMMGGNQQHASAGESQQ